jgi:hypothetical protein
MQKVFRLTVILLCFAAYSSQAFSQKKQNIGIGVQGNAYFSPLVTGKKYYGAYGSLNIRKPSNMFETKVYMGVQFDKDIQVLDFGTTFRFLPTAKLVYIGISPVSYRAVTLKSTLDSQTPTTIGKLYGAAHLGFQIPLGRNINFEIESNYHYFYEQKAGGYGLSIGFVFFNDDIVNGVADYMNKRN